MSISRLKRGDVITAEWINRLVDAVNAAGVHADTGTMEARKTPRGTFLRARGNDSVLLYKTTSSIAKRSGTTLGSGTAHIWSIDSAGSLTDTGVSVTLYSMWTDKAVSSGAYVLAAEIGGMRVVTDVDDCDNLS